MAFFFISLFSWKWPSQTLCLYTTTSAHLPDSDSGSLEKEPSLLMVLMTKFFSRVKLVNPTDSELSITNTMSKAPQRFSQSADAHRSCVNWRFFWVYGLNHKPQTSLGIKLTAATASLPDVVHDITFLQGQKSYYTFHFKHHRLWSILWLNTLTVRPGSPSGPGSPFKRGWRIKWMEKKTKK